ncbi:hypothetical protein BDF20DRAFT_908939 [Mycotypha africana]|uniref:uncharacterized protein n=1 Tax=Mycotypha africana TaxID=64632 RepID=UPI0022FFD918|nr:uncharacterized protein BDF20DRAFT_908939 [Mycotypha africana]KAI8991136.1 hypothetical protein BDF20DRAFT_908939 [Mycotypha africana]
MSFTNLSTHDTHPLALDEELIIGRHKFGLESVYISAHAVKLFYTKEGRCYATKEPIDPLYPLSTDIYQLTKKVVRLNKAAMPKDREMQLKDGDVLVFSIDGIKTGRTMELKFSLPDLGDDLNRHVAVIHGKEDNEQEPMPPGPQEDYETDQSHEDYISDHSAEFDEAIRLSDLSDESDYLGDESYLLSLQK